MWTGDPFRAESWKCYASIRNLTLFASATSKCQPAVGGGGGVRGGRGWMSGTL